MDVRTTSSPVQPAAQSQLSRQMDASRASPRPSLADWQRPLVSYPSLSVLGYSWHPGLCLLMCSICRSAVSPASLKDHSTSDDRHDFAQKQITEFVNELASGCRFGDREGRLPVRGVGEKMPRLELLDDVMALQCPCCDKLYVEVESMKRHCRKKHGGSSGKTYDRILCQYLFKGKAGVVFPVAEAAEPDAADDSSNAAVIAQELQSRIAEYLQKGFKADWTTKDAWPYLKDVPWHHVVTANEGVFEVPDLRMMVTIPPMHTQQAKETWPGRLAKMVQELVLSLEAGVRDADYRLKQLLGTGSGE